MNLVEKIKIVGRYINDCGTILYEIGGIAVLSWTIALGSGCATAPKPPMDPKYNNFYAGRWSATFGPIIGQAEVEIKHNGAEFVGYMVTSGQQYYSAGNLLIGGEIRGDQVTCAVNALTKGFYKNPIPRPLEYDKLICDGHQAQREFIRKK